MATKASVIFSVMLLLQVVALLLYLTVKDNPLENIYSSRQELDSRGSFQDNSTFHAANSTLLPTNLFHASTGVSPKPSILFTFIEEEGFKHNASVGGLSNIQKERPIDQKISRLPKQEYFQSVDGKEAWFYSAFYDYVAAGQGHPSVRLFGVVDNKFLVKAFCNLSLVDGKSLWTNASVHPLPDCHSARNSFSPSSLECPLPSNVRPTHVSISFQEKATPTNRLLVQYPGPCIRNVTVCFSVIHSNNSLTTQFIQAMEMNQILGAEHFIVYVHNASTQLGKIMRLYEDDGILTIKQWPLPTNKSHYFSQMAALNDCVYRNRNTSRFVVVVDTDELIIPKNNNNWMELIKTISPHEIDVSYFLNSSVPAKSRTSYTGCFMVRSSFFATDSTPNWSDLPKKFNFDNKEKKNIIRYDIRALSQLVREQKIFPYRSRTKYIARPELVWDTGIHFVRSFVYPMKCVNVSESLALVHHYRKWGLQKYVVSDTSILKFKHLLYPRVMRQLERLKSIFT